MPPQKIIESILQGDFNLPKSMSVLAKDLVKGILQVGPNMRLEISEIKRHKFFKGIDWARLA